MTVGERRVEPVYEIDLRDLTDEEKVVVVPDLGAPRLPEPGPPRPDDLEHPDPSVRKDALSALAARPDSIPLAAVAARLQDPDPAVREAAIETLEASGDEETLVVMIDAIQDPVERVRKAVGEALRRHRSPRLLTLIRGELRVPEHADAADRALALLLEAPESRRDAEDVADVPPDDVPGLVRLLGDPRPERRRIACERLGYRRAHPAVEPLLERLRDPERGVRIKAATALGMIGDPRAAEGLERARAEDPDPGVALAMATALRAVAEGA